MAKTVKKTGKKGGKKAPRRANKQSYNGFTGSSVVSRDGAVLAGHWDMVSNPCFSDLAESAYRGQSGFTQRFTSVRTYTTGTDTAFLALYSPAGAAMSFKSGAADTTVFTPVFDIATTGQTFLAATASQWRCIGFCVDIEYVGTELARAGVIGSGTYVPNTIPAGTATNVLNVSPMFSNVTRTSDQTMTAKWFPGVGNERYMALGEGNDLLFGNDTTALAIYGVNMPAGLQVRFVETAIYEWLPKTLQGINYPSATAGRNPVGAFERIHDMASRDPSFAHSFLAGAKTKLGKYGRMAGESAMDVLWEGSKYAARSVARSAARAAPLLLM
jgi:hypothetical protein